MEINYFEMLRKGNPIDLPSSGPQTLGIISKMALHDGSS